MVMERLSTKQHKKKFMKGSSRTIVLMVGVLVSFIRVSSNQTNIKDMGYTKNSYCSNLTPLQLFMRVILEMERFKEKEYFSKIAEFLYLSWTKFINLECSTTCIPKLSTICKSLRSFKLSKSISASFQMA
jgi:hypothetical protein